MDKILIDKETIIKLYWGQQLSVDEVRKILKVAHTTLERQMNEFGIARRTRSEATKLAMAKVDRTGQRNPNWRGGKWKMKGGYLYVAAPGHPRATIKGKYVAEHILIWEKTHNQPLPKGWIIHHLNGIKNDNRPENLLALPTKKHRLLLREYQKHIRQLENELKALKKQRNLL